MNQYPWVEQVVALFEQEANPEIAAPMAKYMKNHFPFLGLTSQKRKDLLADPLKNLYNDCNPEELFEIIHRLWQQPEREFQYAALATLEKFQRKLQPEHIPLLLPYITEKSWWDSVDCLAGSILSKIVKTYPDSLTPYFQPLIQSPNFWENRTAIIVQLKAGNATDTEFLEQAIVPHLHQKEFFIRKAIGWSLRQYARFNAPWVINFVSQYESQLSGLSKREALKHLKSF